MGRSNKVFKIKCLARKRDVRLISSLSILLIRILQGSSRDHSLATFEKHPGGSEAQLMFQVISVGSGGHAGFGSGRRHGQSWTSGPGPAAWEKEGKQSAGSR